MSSPVLSSTFFLTVLLAVGLFFFIRASVKDRTEQVQVLADDYQGNVLSQLQQYFEQRAYHLASVNPQDHQIIFEGLVRPSWFLAIFLSLLAGVGLLCLGLVLMLLFPSGGNSFFALIALSPLAGWFYWQKAGRSEQVRLQVETLPNSERGDRTLITVSAHRDELIELQRSLDLKFCD